jgi:hypothetical protein
MLNELWLKRPLSSRDVYYRSEYVSFRAYSPIPGTRVGDHKLY